MFERISVLALALAQSPPCETTELEYVLAANLKLSETPMGQGDGVYPIGPGRVVLRLEGDRVTVTHFSMVERFTIDASAVFWSARVTTDTVARAAPDAGVIAEGTFDGRVIRWDTPFRGYRVDGTLRCEGSLCGKFGAPPAGASELHAGPYAQWFKPWVFSEDGQTFTMATTRGLETESPKQRSEIAISGRRSARRCVSEAP